jgi:Carboxypeptidase regulatory-like domain/Fibronectin type III domain
MRRIAFLSLVILAACDPSITPKNPYDPATPSELQAKATLRGRLRTNLLSSLLNVQVGLRRAGAPQSPTACDDAGAFVFSGLTPGQFEVAIAPTGFAPLSLSAALKAGQDLDLGDIDLVPLTGAQGARINGRVTLEGLDPLAADLSGTLVEVTGTAFTAVTNTSGQFDLSLIPGSYTLRYSHPAFKTWQAPAAVVVSSGETFVLPDDVLLYINPAHVFGHVDLEQPDGTTTTAAGVTISVDGATGSASTDPAGDFELLLPAGSYLMRFRQPGFSASTMPVLNLVGGERRNVDALRLALARGGIAGRVALADGGDPSGTVVEVTGAGRATVAAADGRFSLDGLLVGIYEVSAHRDGYGRALQGSITVTEGNVADAGTLLLARQGGTVSIVEAPYTTSTTVHVKLDATGVTHYHASEDPAFADAARGDLVTDWHPFTTGQSYAFTLAASGGTTLDGEHRVYVAFSTDGASPSATLSTSVVLDRLAPGAVGLVVGDGSGWSRTTDGLVSLALTAQDLPAVPGAAVSGLGKMQLVNGLDFGAPGVATLDYNTSAPWTVSPGDGLKTISVRYLDRALNVSAVATAQVRVDTQRPANPTLALAGPDTSRPTFTTSPIVTATVDVTDENALPDKSNLFVRLSNTPGFVGVRYQPFTPQLTWVLTPGDGVKTVWAQFMDPAGNESAAIPATITLKTTGPISPTLAIIENDTRQNGHTNSRAISLRLDAVGPAVLARVAENPALTGGVDISLAGVTLPHVTVPADGVQLADLDGPHTLWVRYYDAAGNASEPAAASVELDRTRPAATPPLLTPSGFASTAAVTLTMPAAGQDEVQVSGAASGLLPWNAAPTGAVVPLTLTAGDGAKAFTVTYRDLADNLSDPIPLAVTLDGTRPTAFDFTVTGALADGTPSTGVTATTAVTLALGAAVSDAGAGVTSMLLSESPSLTGASWQPFVAAAPFSLSTGDGPKVVYAMFRDGAGNVTATTVRGLITLDTLGPTTPSVTITESDTRPTNGYTNSRSVALTLSAVGATRALVAENPAFTGALVVSGTFPVTTPLSGAGSFSLSNVDGLHTVWVRYVDAAGNLSDPATAQVVLDRVGPTATPPAMSATGATRLSSVSLTLPGAGQDEVQVGGSGVTAVAWTPAAAGAVLPVSLTAGDGAKAFTVTYRDLADNVSAAMPLSILLDTAAPLAGVFAVTGTLGDGGSSTTLTATTAVALDFSGVTDPGGAAASGVVEMQVSESPTLAGAAWQPFSAAPSFTLSAGEGLKSIYAKFRDAAGNPTASAVQGQITLDTLGPTAPSLAIVETDGLQNGYTNTAGVRLTLGAAGAPVRAQVADNPAFTGAVSIGLASNPHTTPGAVLSLSGPDGVKTVYARLYDAAGNASQLATATVVYDTTAPLALPPTITPSGYTGNPVIALTPPAAGQDELQVGGTGAVPLAFTPSPAGAPIAVTLTPADGPKSLVVTYRDFAGNQTALAPLSVTLDRTPPSVSDFVVTGALADGTPSTSLTTTGTVTLAFAGAVTDTGSGVAEMLLYEAATAATATWQPYQPTATFTLTPGDAVKKVYARFRDAVGNASAVAVQGQITLDTTGPTSPGLVLHETDSRPSNGYTNNRSVTLDLTAVGALRAFVAENLAFTGATTVTGSFTGVAYQLSDVDGPHTVYVRFADAAGNLSSPASAQVTLDRVAPTATPPTVTPSGFAPTTAITLTMPAAGQDEVTVTGTGVTTVAYTAAPTGAVIPVTLTGGDGAKPFSVTYRDLADNTSAPVPLSVTLDGAAPSASSFTVNGTLADGSSSTSLTTTTSVTLSFAGAVTDAGAGVKEMLLYEAATAAAATWQPYAASAPYTLTAGEGLKTVYARFRDGVGNATLVAVQGQITLDTTGPSAPTLALIEQDTRSSNGYTNSTAIQAILGASGTPVRAVISESPLFTSPTTVDLTGKLLPYTTPLGTFALSPSDGLHVIWVKYLDAAGNASTVVTAQVILDRIGPSATPPTLSPASYARNTALSLTPPSAGQDELQVSGSGVGNLAWTAAPAGVAIPLTLVSGDGTKSFTVTWRDLADNQSAPIPLSVMLDAAPPTLPGTFAITGTLGDGTTSTGFTASTGVTLALQTGVSDATSGVAEMLISNRGDFADATWQPYLSSNAVPWTLPPGDGPPVKTVYAKFRDAAGNATASFSTGTIDLRATPPSGGSLQIAGGATDTVSSTPIAAISATGATEMYVTINGATMAAAPGWTGYQTSLPLKFLVEGPQLVAVRFRNAARVEGGSVSASINFDLTAPAAPDVGLVGSRGDGLVESTGTWTAINPVSVTIPGTVGATVAADVASMRIAQGTSASSCGTSPTLAAWQPYVASTTLLLSGLDGVKYVCAQLRDRAGNIGPVGFKTIKLDTTPPTNPSFADLATTITSAGGVTAHLVAASVDPAPGSVAPTYQCYSSPASPQWVDCAPGAGLSFHFNLTRNAPNVVGVRARDDAFNVSAGTLVSVLQDSVAPLPPNVTDVQTTRDSLTLTWDASPDTDVVSYRVYYGNFAGDFAGTGAAQGASPVLVPASGQASQSFTLTGLTTSYPYYVAVEAVDAAGNVSGPSGQRFAQPNEVNPRLLSTYGGQPRAIAIRSSLARTFAYELQNQAVVQLDVTNEASVPVVTGRASLPNFVPDSAAPVVTFDCTRTNRAKVVVPGHCLVAPGSTLEGDFRADPEGYRAPAPVVFFPVAGGDGTVVSVLPARPQRVAWVAAGGSYALFTVERTTVKAFDMSNVTAPRLLATLDLSSEGLLPSYPGIQSVLAAGEVWGSGGVALAVVAKPGRATLDALPYKLYELDVHGAWSGSMTLASSIWLMDAAATQYFGYLYSPGVNSFTPYIADYQVYGAWQDTSLGGTGGTWIGEWVPGSQGGTGQPWDAHQLSSYTVTANAPVAVVAGNMRVYVFCTQPGAMADPGPYAYQLYSDGGMSVTNEIWDLYSDARNAALGVFTATNSSDTEHLLVIDQDASAGYSLQRWSVNDGTSAVTYNPRSFKEVDPTWFAESDGLIFVTQSDKIFTLDVSNPLSPRLIQTYASPDAPGFWKAHVHGRYLYVANNGGALGVGVYVFRINGNGSLTYVSHPTGGNGYSQGDFAVRGKYLYVAYGWLLAYDMTTVSAPVLTAWLNNGCYALDARPAVISGTTYEAEIACGIWGGPGVSDSFQLVTFAPPATLAAVAGSALTLPFDVNYYHPTNVSLRGTQAIVGNVRGSVVVNVGTPTSTSLSSTVLTSTGPVLAQGGYFVGLGKVGAASGPDFLDQNTGAVAGTLLFSTCAGNGSLASGNGVYHASCGKNGISTFAVPSPSAGTILVNDPVAQTWGMGTHGSLAVDGSYAYVSGPAVQGEYGRLYTVDLGANPTAWPGVPYYTSGNKLPGGDAVMYFLLQDGHLWDFEGLYNGSGPSIRALVPTDPYSTWPARVTYTLPYRVGYGTGPAYSQPVTDGEYAYANVLQTFPVTSTPSNDLVTYDFRYPPALAGWTSRLVGAGMFGALALARDRLYAGASTSSSIKVYDTSGGGWIADTTLYLKSSVTGVTGLTVRGQYLFATYTSSELQGNGLSIYKLGAANRDGSGAVLVADFPSALPLSSPTVVGDTLYVLRNLGLTTWDLRPLWQDGLAPVATGGTVSTDAQVSRSRMVIDGPWAYLVGDTYRTFDLRQ